MESKILAFETSTDVCSVSYQDDEGVIFEKRTQGRSVHSDHVFLFTQELMQEHDFKIWELNTVLVSNGPGSYTGLRIAASAVKGMLFGTKVNLFEANTLAGFAQSVIDKAGTEPVHAIIDARRTHVYHQAFSKGENPEPLGTPAVKELMELEAELIPGSVIVGTGIGRISEAALQGVKVFGSDAITASSLITLFNAQPDSGYFKKTTLEELNPNYLTSNQVNNSNP